MPRVKITNNEAQLIAHAIVDVVADMEGWAGGDHALAFIDSENQYMARPKFIAKVLRIVNAVILDPDEARERVSRLVVNIKSES